MKKLLLYLDNCCFNRPYDDQTQMKVYLETQAKIYIQTAILTGKYRMVWSYMLEYENDQNPEKNRQREIGVWQGRAEMTIQASDEILEHARRIEAVGIKTKDALHLACAISAGADYFLTTDYKLAKKAKSLDEIQVLNPLEFVAQEGGNGHEN